MGLIAKLVRSIIGKVQSKRKLKYYSMDSICYFIYIVLSILHARANRFEIHIISGFKVTGRQETHVKQKYEEWFDAVWKRFSPNSYLTNQCFNNKLKLNNSTSFCFFPSHHIYNCIYNAQMLFLISVIRDRTYQWQICLKIRFWAIHIKSQIAAIIFLITIPC